jgi:hypothetical protein
VEERKEQILNFQKQLAKCMLFNKLDDNGIAPTSPIRFQLRRNKEHEQKRKEVNQGKWNATTMRFNTVNTPYLPEQL